VTPGPGAGNAQSPAGWLDGGSQLNTAISGNNVSAYLDADGNNRPDRGGTLVTTGDFLASANLTESPSTANNRAVAVQNLFYLSNVVHDILYSFGFDEAAGNFQDDNFGHGGRDGDSVLAEAQDGSDTDNANFATPPDGRNPRMQMFLWTGAGATHRLTVNGTNFAAMGAAFGPALTVTGVTGQMVTTAPADGCTPITTPLKGLIALIDRGACDFSAKALNAQLAGAVAVVVANNAGGTAIFPMGEGAGANRVKIPTVMISQNDGQTLKPQTPVSATEARLQQQPLQIDASLDSDVVFHEYGHGLTWRMIGGMSGPLAGAIGEGMSDGVAMLINNDDVIAEYASSNPLGIRRARYQGYPRTYKNVTGDEVHDDGEIYAAIVWRMIELFRAAYGDIPGRSRLFTYIVDGMNFTPSTPAYEQMRDGILASIRNGSTPSDCNFVWQAFGHFGVGAGAQGVVNRSGVTITESFTVPACN
jgi:extracellular elastinolytic metalloproteinase